MAAPEARTDQPTAGRRVLTSPDRAQGIEDFDLVAWFALYAPAATPAAVIARLRDGLDRVLGNPNATVALEARCAERWIRRSLEGYPFGCEASLRQDGRT